jgi:transposase
MEFTIAASSQPQVTVGVDTHKQFHVAHAVDELGRPLGTHQIPAASHGYSAFVSWARSLGQLALVGIEGPGHYGAGLGAAPARRGHRGHRSRPSQTATPCPLRQIR